MELRQVQIWLVVSCVFGVAFSVIRGFEFAALNVRWDVETLINIPSTMLIGIVLVIFAFNLTAPISNFAGTINKSTLGIATGNGKYIDHILRSSIGHEIADIPGG